ncbi:hypothetical protein [Vibrio sp. TRT 17S01]|uniref:hypothetical protein n=1 Tax=Vibrio sp. TRT 17S01 TaxID=3418505 RepID=UPI003CFB67FC
MPESKIVKKEGILVPVELKFGYSRGNSGVESRFIIKGERPVHLIVNDYLDGYNQFKYGGEYYNQKILIIYSVSETSPNGPYYIVEMFFEGNVIYSSDAEGINWVGYLFVFGILLSLLFSWVKKKN